jgi:hypothetical protein
MQEHNIVELFGVVIAALLNYRPTTICTRYYALASNRDADLRNIFRSPNSGRRNQGRTAARVMAPEYDLSIAEVSGPVALRSASQVDRLSSVAALLKRL